MYDFSRTLEKAENIEVGLLFPGIVALPNLGKMKIAPEF